MSGDAGDLYRAKDNGTGVTHLVDCTETSTDCAFANLAVSPSAQTVALDVGWNRIDLIDFDGKGRTTVLDNPNGLPTSAKWHPDSHSLAYTRYGDFPGFDPEGNLTMCSGDSFPLPVGAILPGTDADGDGWLCVRFKESGDLCWTDGGLLVGGDTEVYRTEVYKPRGEERTHKLLIGGPGNQRDVDFSSNGQFVAYSGQGDLGSPFTLFVAEADGCNAAGLDTSQIEGSIFEPKISPDGSRIAFYARPQEWPGEDFDYEAWTINTDGSDLQRLTVNDVDDYAPQWSPDGTRIIFDSGVEGRETWLMNADGSGQHRIFAGGVAYPGVENEGTYREPSAFMDQDDYDAARFRPRFMFDSDERWRPLHVGRFVREVSPTGGPLHMTCDVTHCESEFLARGLDALQDFTHDAWIDIGDLGLGGDPHPEDYRSPREGCGDDFLRDCDAGDDSAVYYNATITAGYKYLDYWTFYRMNDFQSAVLPNGVTEHGEHEGDWEGVTVGLGGTPDTFDFAAFAQHDGPAATYLRSSLQCDDGGGGSCGSEGLRSGRRLRVFVANGSHASYADPCDSGVTVWPPQGRVCGQSGGPGVEGDRDGNAGWGRNHDEPMAGSFLRIPKTHGWSTPTSASWADWAGMRSPGHWGADCAPTFEKCDGHDTVKSPQSPGLQRRFWCPQQKNVFDMTPCIKPARRQSGPQIPNNCATWFGESVVAAACSPATLRTSLRAKRLGRKGTLRLTRNGQTSAGSAPGVAQVLGAPLGLGERLSLKGTTYGATTVAVRALVGDTRVEGYFPGVRLRAQTATVKVVGSKKAPRLVLLLPNGDRGEPAKVDSWRMTPSGWQRAKPTPQASPSRDGSATPPGEPRPGAPRPEKAPDRPSGN